MAITSIDQVLAGMLPMAMFASAPTPTLVAGRMHSFWRTGGIPAAAPTPVGGLDGEVLSSLIFLPAGRIPVPLEGSGDMHLARFCAFCTATGGMLFLYDRLWQNAVSATTTALQVISSPTWPPRDNWGSEFGEGVLLALEVMTATGPGTPSVTVDYTNQYEAPERTATLVYPTHSSAPIGAWYPLSLAESDMGVSSVQSIQLSASWSSGSLALVAYRPLAVMAMPASTASDLDALACGLPRLYDGSVPFLVLAPSGTAATMVYGGIACTQG